MCISTGNFDSTFFLGVSPFLNLEIWPKWYYSTQFVSATPLKSLNRITWNFVVMKDIMCTCAYPQEILIQFFFLGVTPFLNLEIWRKLKILLKQLVSATPLKPLYRIAWNFVVMKDIMCRYAFLQEKLIWSFWGAIYIPFFVRLPITNAWNCHSLYTAFSSNVGAWGMWACSLFLSLTLILLRFIS